MAPLPLQIPFGPFTPLVALLRATLLPLSPAAPQRGAWGWMVKGQGVTRAKSEGREIRTPNLLIWSQTRCRCAIPPMTFIGNIGDVSKDALMHKFSCDALGEPQTFAFTAEWRSG